MRSSLARRAARKARVLAAAPFARATIGRETFDSPYGPLRYLVHPYNHTWRYERCIEVPIAAEFIRRQRGPGLEVGNVLGHYMPVRHRVVDKYERQRGVENTDVAELEGHYGYIVSISTLEHVGWDPPEPPDPAKALEVLGRLRKMTSALLVSFRLGHHPALTDLVLSGSDVMWERVYRQQSGRWAPITLDEARQLYDPQHCDLLWIGELATRAHYAPTDGRAPAPTPRRRAGTPCSP